MIIFLIYITEGSTEWVKETFSKGECDPATKTWNINIDPKRYYACLCELFRYVPFNVGHNSVTNRICKDGQFYIQLLSSLLSWFWEFVCGAFNYVRFIQIDSRSVTRIKFSHILNYSFQPPAMAVNSVSFRALPTSTAMVPFRPR